MDFNLNTLFKKEDNEDQFFAPLWSQRSENAYSDFFKGGGWKKPKEWINPGGVMANPAQQIADPGNFYTTGEHENWISDGKVADRTLLSAAIAALAYGGGSAISAAGEGGGAGGAGGGAIEGINPSNFSLMSDAGGGSTSFSLMGDSASTASPSLFQAGELQTMAPTLFGSSGVGSGTDWTQFLNSGGSSNQEEAQNHETTPIVQTNTESKAPAAPKGGYMASMKESWNKMSENFKNNPEQLTMLLDALGKGIAPDNPFAGVGTSFAKSSLANKAKDYQQGLLSKAAGGQQAQMTPGPVQVPTAAPKNTGMDLLTPANQQGPTAVTYKRQPDGSVVSSTNAVVQTPQQNQPATVNASDMNAVVNALAGKSPDLTGLDPQQIAQFTQQNANISKYGTNVQNQKMAQVVARDKIAAELANKDVERMATQALTLQRQASAKKSLMDAAIAEKKAPAEIKKLEGEYKTMLKDMDELDQKILERTRTNDAIAKADAQGLDSLTEGETISAFGGPSAASMRNTTVTQGRLAEQNRVTNKANREKAYADSVANIFNGEVDAEQVIGDVARANANSPDNESTFYLMDDGSGLFNTAGPEAVKLPVLNGKQITMQDVRFNADKYGKSYNEIYDQFMKLSEGE